MKFTVPFSHTSTICLATTSSVGSEAIPYFKPNPDHQLSPSMIRKIGSYLESKNIPKFDDKWYKMLAHPYDVYDLLNEVTTIDILRTATIKSMTDINCLEFAGFRIHQTAAINSPLIFTPLSDPLNFTVCYSWEEGE